MDKHLEDTERFLERVGKDSSIFTSEDICGETLNVATKRLTPKEQTTSSMWATAQDRYWGVQKAEKELPKTIFACEMSDGGPLLRRVTNETDNLIHLPDSSSEYVLNEIKEFIKLEPEFRNRGFIYKRGILLYGPPGSGKSCTVRLLVDLVLEELGGIALHIENPHIAIECLHLIRQIEPNRQIIGILEDFDSLVRRFDEHSFLALLDGEHQVDNIVYVATTNYPERLDRRFVDRPSRFDTLVEVDMPTAEARRVYLATKEPSLKGKALDKYVAETDGFSLAHLRELIILTHCFKKPFTSSVKRLRSLIDGSPTSDRRKPMRF